MVWFAIKLERILPSTQTAADVSSQEDSIAKITVDKFHCYMINKVCKSKGNYLSMIICRNEIIYLLRIATTGSILAACLAGINPANMPTIIQMMIARGHIRSGNKDRKSSVLL